LKSGLYLDTSVISALFDKRTPERMAQTETARSALDDFDVFISEIVVSELERTPAELRTKLTEATARFSVLPLTDEARELANEYTMQGIFPRKYYDGYYSPTTPFLPGSEPAVGYWPPHVASSTLRGPKPPTEPDPNKTDAASE
jgi:predicted nucleic acid-binding protein